MTSTRPQTAGVIFDLDGVIIDSEELQYRSYCQVLERFGVHPSRQEYGRHWIAAGRGPEYAVKAYKLPLEPDELRALKNPVYHELLRSDVTLMPGATDALTRLCDSFPIALATNSSRYDVDYVLDRFRLLPFFSAVVTREDYVGAKPEPDAFLTATQRLTLPAERCVVIEDAFKGVVAAHRAGCKCIAIPNPFTADNDFSLASATLASLAELTRALVEQTIAASCT